MSQTATVSTQLEPADISRGLHAETIIPYCERNESARKTTDDRRHETIFHMEPRPLGETDSTARKIYAARPRAFLVIAHLTMVNFMASVTTGMITVAIPIMALDLSIPPQTHYLPLSVYGLTSGACLLPAGAVADVLGSKRVFVVGILLLSIFIMACGLAQTEIQLVMFRAMQGIAMSMCLPTSVGILTNAIAPGRRRNVGFACTGLGQPLGFSVGTVFGGVFVNTVGWRVGWYVVAATLTVLFPLGIYLLPKDTLDDPPTLHALRKKVDWVGAAISSAALAILAYVLVQLSTSQELIHTPTVIALLAISLLLIPVFAWWMNFAPKHDWPVLIPNPFWKKSAFTSACIMVLLSYGVMQTMELFCSLFFQNVQGHNPLQASIMLLPSMIVGAILNLATGLFVNKVSPLYLVLGSSIACAGAPLLMALVRTSWPYWYAAFPAQILQPLSADVLFCVGLIVISEVFPDNMQALAGAVFNTSAQFGTSIGLALIGVVADSVTQSSDHTDKTDPKALLEGYKAGFWTIFGWMLLTCAVAVVGLRGVGRVGLKRE